MRGPDPFTESLFRIKKLDDFVPAAHPLRAMLLQVLYSVHSERMLMEPVGAGALQPAVSLVHWPVDGRCGVGADAPVG